MGDGKANPLMDRKVVEVFLEWLLVAVGTSPQLLDVVWCRGTVAVVVVQWSCSCGVVHLV